MYIHIAFTCQIIFRKKWFLTELRPFECIMMTLTNEIQRAVTLSTIVFSNWKLACKWQVRTIMWFVEFCLNFFSFRTALFTNSVQWLDIFFYEINVNGVLGISYSLFSEVKKCERPSVPENGYLEPPVCMSSAIPVGTLCHFHCSEGYSSEGKATTECTRRLRWTLENMPACVQEGLFNLKLRSLLFKLPKLDQRF